jgi:hypothetical protein
LKRREERRGEGKNIIVINNNQLWITIIYTTTGSICQAELPPGIGYRDRSFNAMKIIR